MSDQEKTYQPGWGDSTHRHHHHHRSGNSKRSSVQRLKRKDRQAYYGLIILAIAGLGLIGMLLWQEISTLPMDDPDTELTVDELRIHKVEEQNAVMMGDSLAQAYDLDSIRQTVMIETTPVYRPPRRENTWYITRREWKEIWRNLKIWRWEKKHEQQ